MPSIWSVFGSLAATSSTAASSASNCERDRLECHFYDYEGKHVQNFDKSNYKEIIPNAFIHTVEKCQHALYNLQPVTWIFRHDFVIVGACDGKWYSVENNTECILVQRGTREEVLNFIYGKERNSEVSCSQVAKAHSVLYLLIEWLIKNETEKGYSLLYENCQTFAIRAIEFLQRSLSDVAKEVFAQRSLWLSVIYLFAKRLARIAKKLRSKL